MTNILSRGRWLGALLLAILALAAAMELQPRAAFGHADLATASPSPNAVLDAPPQRVTVLFTEPVELELSSISVLDARGARVDHGEAIADREDPRVVSVDLHPLADGTYTVAWRNVSTVDGHLRRGSFLFSVGERVSGESPHEPQRLSPLEPVLRWLVLLGVLALAGGIVFKLLVARLTLSGLPRDDAHGTLIRSMGSRSRRLLALALGVFGVSSVAHLLLQATLIHEVALAGALGEPLWATLTDTEWGRLWTWRMVLATGLASVLFYNWTAERRLGDAEGRPWAELAALAHTVGMIWTLSLASHGAATAGIRTYALFADFLHLAAAAFWTGALFHLAASLPLFFRYLTAEQRGAALATIVPRFSVVASLSVGAVLVSGVFNAWAQITVPEGLATPYGRALMAKLVLVLPLLLLGGINLVWVRPRLARVEASAVWLRRLVIGEAALAVLVVAAVGLLTSLEPGRQVAAREGRGVEESLTFHDASEGAHVTLEIVPGRLGANDLSVHLADRLGNPIVNASDVTVRLTYLEADLGEAAAQAVHTGDGLYVTEGSQMSIAGAWQAEVVARRPDAFDARFAFRFEADARGAGGDSLIVPSTNTAGLILGIGLGMLGGLFMVVGLPLGGWYTRAGAGVMLPGIAGFMAGVALIVGSQVGGDSALRNPFPPNEESIQIGREVYQARCLSCHGETGRGDGPAAAGLNPPPADIVLHAPLHPEAGLFKFVRDGIPDTAMAALGDVLTADEIWHVINYVKSLE